MIVLEEPFVPTVKEALDTYGIPISWDTRYLYLGIPDTHTMGYPLGTDGN